MTSLTKVQCKRTISTIGIGAPDVQTLVGALARGRSELGLFVTLGSYSAGTLHIERTQQDLRSIDGNQLVEVIFEHHKQLGPEWKRLVPLRRIDASTAMPVVPEQRSEDLSSLCPHPFADIRPLGRSECR